MLRVSHNLPAMNSNRQFNMVVNSGAKSTEKLSSGYRINRSADDAAGLAISEKMRRQIRGLTQASTNAQDGISMVQTAEGGLNEVHDMLQRMNELSVKSATGTLSETDRQYIDEEIQQLKREINRVADTTKFNEIQLFPSDGSASSIYAAQYDITINPDGTYTAVLNSDAYSFTKDVIDANSTETATYLAETLMPEAINAILDKYPALQSERGDLNLKLDMTYVDGPNGTLAYAQYSYGGASYEPVQNSFLVKVDTADFTDENALVGGSRNDLLKSTLYHELTHSVMQYTMSKQMATQFPTWFKEGTAQLSGGGYATGWNTGLNNLYKREEAGETVDDSEYLDYLRSATVDNRPYGHGYLATAYMAYLAHDNTGSDPVTADNLVDGINKIFDEIKNNGKSFEDAVQDATGKSVSQIVNSINGNDSDAIPFIRGLNNATKDGAGSALFGTLDTGTQLMGALPSNGSTSPTLIAANTLGLQVGAEANQHIDVDLFSIGTKTLGLEYTDTLTVENSNKAINAVKGAIMTISSIRSYYGAIQNRLEHTIKNLDNVVENTTSAESKIRDTDMATEMVSYANNQILQQAGQAMLSQANRSNDGVLSLLS